MSPARRGGCDARAVPERRSISSPPPPPAQTTPPKKNPQSVHPVGGAAPLPRQPESPHGPRPPGTRRPRRRRTGRTGTPQRFCLECDKNWQADPEVAMRYQFRTPLDPHPSAEPRWAEWARGGSAPFCTFWTWTGPGRLRNLLEAQVQHETASVPAATDWLSWRASPAGAGAGHARPLSSVPEDSLFLQMHQIADTTLRARSVQSFDTARNGIALLSWEKRTLARWRCRYIQESCTATLMMIGEKWKSLKVSRGRVPASSGTFEIPIDAIISKDSYVVRVSSASSDEVDGSPVSIIDFEQQFFFLTSTSRPSTELSPLTSGKKED